MVSVVCRLGLAATLCAVPTTTAAQAPTGNQPPPTIEVRVEVIASTQFKPINDELRELEKRRMSEALAAAGGVKTRAAQLIDMPIRTFTLKLKQYKL